MNDILAPIFAVFFSSFFNKPYSLMVNNMSTLSFTEEDLLEVEADSYFCFELFLSTMKSNYLQSFDGITQNLNKLSKLL